MPACACGEGRFRKDLHRFFDRWRYQDDIRLMRQTVGPTLGVKASGGIRSFDAVRRMVAAGATRIGTSSGVQILKEFRDGFAAPNATPGAY